MFCFFVGKAPYPLKTLAAVPVIPLIAGVKKLCGLFRSILHNDRRLFCAAYLDEVAGHKRQKQGNGNQIMVVFHSVMSPFYLGFFFDDFILSCLLADNKCTNRIILGTMTFF